MKKLVVIFACVAAVVTSVRVYGAELGRREISSRDPAATATTYGVSKSEGSTGLDVSLVWCNLRWDVDADGYSDKLWVPQASLYFDLNNMMDIRVAARFTPLEDDAMDLDVIRTGIGTKICLPSQTDWNAFVTVLINYYAISSDTIDDVEGVFGLSAEMGVSYVASDFVLVNASVQSETGLGDATGKRNGSDCNISLNGYGLGVGVTFLF